MRFLIDRIKTICAQSKKEILYFLCARYLHLNLTYTTELNCACLMSKEKIVLEITILYCVGALCVVLLLLLLYLLLLYTLCVKFKSGNVTFFKMKLYRGIVILIPYSFRYNNMYRRHSHVRLFPFVDDTK